MSEIFAWPEATLHIWTGSHTASGNPIGYVERARVACLVDWQSDPAVDGTYRAHTVDERAEYEFEIGWVQGEPLKTLHAARTAVHVKLLANMPTLGSAGIVLYSAVMPELSYEGFQRGTFTQLVNGFAHSWSAF